MRGPGRRRVLRVPLRLVPRRGLVAVVAALAVALAAPAAGAPPAVGAPAYVVVGAPDGALLAARAEHERRAVASITKLMTVLVALDRAALDDVVVVSPAATRVGGATAFLRPGEQLTVRELALATLVPSANDAATALALHVGRGSLPRFVALMNTKAAELGLSDTRFVTPHGLDAPGHVSSARDVVRLLRAALADPFVRQAAGATTATIAGGRTLVSTDDLLATYPPLVAGKTGYTERAGWSQVAAARSRGVTVFAAVLGLPTREQRNDDLRALLDWGLASYRPVAVVDASRTYARSAATYGRPAVRLVAPRTIVRPARVGRPLVERVVAPTTVTLPVVKGARLGQVRVYDGTRLVASSPLVAAETVAEPGSMGKLRWYATRTVHHLVGLVS